MAASAKKTMSESEKKRKAVLSDAKKKAAADKKKAAAAAKKEPKLVDHLVTQDDLDANPDLVEKGVNVGDTIQLPAKADGAYHLTVEMNGESMECDTDTIADAIMSFNPKVFKTKVVIRAEYEGRKAQFTLMIPRAKRTFRNKLAAIFFEKSLKLALNGR